MRGPWLVWLTLLSSGLLPAQVEAPLAARLDHALEGYVPFGWSGAALVAGGGHPLLSRGYGLADRDHGRANTARTLFEIASVTKQFTATAILLLEQEGKIATDDPISRHLPAVPASCKGITVHHLLTHTSGIPHTNGRGRGHDLARAVASFLEGGPRFPPGTHFAYWNGGYSLLAGIVERASGMSFMAYCREHLFRPAGMSDTGFTGDGHLDAARAAIGASYDGSTRSALEHPYGDYGWQYRGMGGAVTTVRDLWLWHRALRDDTVLGKDARAKLMHPFLDGYACGWRVTQPRHGGRCVWHGGAVRGFTSHFRRYPDDDACIILLANTDAVPLRPLAEVLESILFNRPSKHPPPPQVIALSRNALKAYQGVYMGDAGDRVTVRMAADGLTAGVEGQNALWALTPVTGIRPPDLDAATRRAVAIVEAISHGNPSPLRAAMASRLPPSWPEDVVRRIWPRHVEEHGPLRAIRPLGAVTIGRRIRVVLALEHDRKRARIRIEQDASGLLVLDWNGPEFPATVHLLPTPEPDVFVERRWHKPLRYRFVRRSGRITGLHAGSLRFARR